MVPLPPSNDIWCLLYHNTVFVISHLFKTGPLLVRATFKMTASVICKRHVNIMYTGVSITGVSITMTLWSVNVDTGVSIMMTLWFSWHTILHSALHQFKYIPFSSLYQLKSASVYTIPSLWGIKREHCVIYWNKSRPNMTYSFNHLPLMFFLLVTFTFTYNLNRINLVFLYLIST